MNDKIKVAGYAQKVEYTDGIEYRAFSPDLVGFQLASNGGTPLFTLGNFYVTTNLEPKLDKFYNSAKFSGFMTLEDLKLSLSQTTTLLSNNAGVYLNLDKSNLNYYALFGSLSEFVRVSLEDIIINWPASLYLYPVRNDDVGNTYTGYTVQNYTYDAISQTSKFTVDTNFIINNFEINYTTNGNIIDSFSSTNNLRNLTINYESYAVLYNDVEYPVLNFTASTNLINDYVYFEVNGNPFPSLTNGIPIYHIKPKKVKEEEFYNGLPDFEAYLLNRHVTPKYTATFKYPIKTDSGVILYVTNSVTWPTSDGYNIDFDTTDYAMYATTLFDIATSNDLFSSNLMNRFLVSESISAFDTTPVHLSDLDQDTSGGKVNKTLQIYGVEYDEINQFILGVQFSNVVSYDKQDNTPDIYLKNLARVLGWELVSSVFDNDLLANYVTTSKSTYSGLTVGLTAVDADIELWRRIILNSPWIWKSKGTRKAIEFFLRFIGVPQGLIKFNEYIYKANEPIDVELFKKILKLQGLNNDISAYPIDSDGYPRPLPDTADMYFQGNGLWYRETGGSGSTIDILGGNNPHVGPYDSGNKYLNQFRELIQNFSAVTVSSSTVTTDVLNLYTNYDKGTFNVSTATTVDTVQISTTNGVNFSDCVVFTPSIENDPNPKAEYNDCGCVSASDDKILSLCVKKNPNGKTSTQCADTMASYYDDTNLGLYDFSFYQYDINGEIFIDSNGNQVLNSTPYASKECCKYVNGTPYLYNNVIGGTVVNSGYLCCDQTASCGCIIACKWMVDLSVIKLPPLSPTYHGVQTSYLQFIKPDGTPAVVTPDGCNCIPGYSIAVPNIFDPYTGEVGYACQLTSSGYDDLQNGLSSEIYQYYLQRSIGTTSCFTGTHANVFGNNIFFSNGTKL
jgi:hypothetical protein